MDGAESNSASESSLSDGGRPAISGLSSIFGMVAAGSLSAGPSLKRKREQKDGPRAAPARKRKDVDAVGAGASGGAGVGAAADADGASATGDGPVAVAGGGASTTRSAAAPPAMDPTAVFVNKIPFNFTDEPALAALFYMCGPVAEARVCRDNEKRGRGFGFVRFATEAGAAAAFSRAETKPFTLAGKHALALGPCRADLVARYEGKPTAGDGIAHDCVFVKHVPLRVTDSKELGHAFSTMGTVVEARVALGTDGKSKGFGFVRFSSPAEATVALSQVTVVAERPVVVEPCKQEIVDKFHEMPGAPAPAFASVTTFKPRGLRK